MLKALQKDNQAFLMMCKKGAQRFQSSFCTLALTNMQMLSGEEQYSEPEIAYYGGEAPFDASMRLPLNINARF